MKTRFECIPCYVKQAFTVFDLVKDTSESEKLDVIRKVLEYLSHMPMDVSPSLNGTMVHRILKEHLGSPDPFKEEKSRHNRLALELLPELEQRVADSDEPLIEAVRIAIAGNIIDYGTGQAAGSVDLKNILESVEFAREHISDLAARLEKAANVLYLADNAGEIVFDRPLIEYMISLSKRVRVAVKSEPIINDATREDALEAGIAPEIIIETGSDDVGTCLEAASDEFRKEFELADLTIAKGQGQFETLHEYKEEPIFFLLKAKCPVVAQELKVEQGGMVAIPVDKV